MNNLFAVLVGINEYPAPVPKLKGCVQDINQVNTYLEKTFSDKYHPLTLVDEQATKQGIVGSFRSHLSQAIENDVVLFYFSGHGTTEVADPVFWDMQSRKLLQCLVCYDSITDSGYRLLADKELRYLIQKVSEKGAHIVTIFDCCHSGSNTRSYFQKRQYDFPSDHGAPQRPWNEFIFSEDWPYETFKNKDWVNLLPEGPHVQISACLESESAYEREGNGVFTKSFLDLLNRTGREITYYDLYARLKYFIKNEVRQTPQFYVPAGKLELMYDFFLDPDRASVSNKNRHGSTLMANVVYHPEKGWIMDLGHINGIVKQDNPLQMVSIDGGHTYNAFIKQIDAGSSILTFREGEQPDPKKVYQIFIKGFFSAPIKVFLEDAIDLTAFKVAIENKSGQIGKQIYLTHKEYEADYALRLKNKQLIITHPEEEDIPLVPPLIPGKVGDEDKAITYLDHIAQWEYVKNLYNPNTFLFKNMPVRMLLQTWSVPITAVQSPDSSGIFYIKPELINGRPTGSIKLSIVNDWDKPLYVACLYLSMNFQSTGELLTPLVTRLEPGGQVFLMGGRQIPLFFEREVFHFNYKYSTSFFKVIASTHTFDIRNLELAALPGPLDEEQQYRAGRIRQTGQPDPDAKDWITQLYTLKIENLLYKENP